jgi:hypothetical protein
MLKKRWVEEEGNNEIAVTVNGLCRQAASLYAVENALGARANLGNHQISPASPRVFDASDAW